MTDVLTTSCVLLSCQAISSEGMQLTHKWTSASTDSPSQVQRTQSTWSVTSSSALLIPMVIWSTPLAVLINSTAVATIQIALWATLSPHRYSSFSLILDEMPTLVKWPKSVQKFCLHEKV